MKKVGPEEQPYIDISKGKLPDAVNEGRDQQGKPDGTVLLTKNKLRLWLLGSRTHD